MTTIPDWQGKIKAGADEAVAEWGMVAIVFLVALSAFGLGRLSSLESVLPPAALAEAPTAEKPAALYMGSLLVATRSGSVYYYPWCSGAQKIALANQMWFATEDAAQKAGYKPAKACKGLGN
jgi:Metal binding domain of Ada